MSNENPSGRFWRRSSFSGADAHCVEVAFVREAVIVRDSQNLSAPRVVFSAERWRAFLDALAGAAGEGGGEG
ncbi:DUF397 domain-containing protein [Streptomyces sp. NPDC048441]|uniref:DUF397 domain-containing protein n=1 Tax=Streptomyces sp. NPDC048441 TaxID=3365552 RepID=UPI003722F51D